MARYHLRILIAYPSRAFCSRKDRGGNWWRYWSVTAVQFINSRLYLFSTTWTCADIVQFYPGIGAETARSFAQAGASRIALFGRREQPLLDTKASINERFPNVEVFVASTDITNKDEVNAAFAKFIGNSGGRIDVLISNAAMNGSMEPAGTADPDSFLDAIHKNLDGSMFVAQAFLRHAAPDAVVIDVNSSAAHQNFHPMFASYSIAKFAVFRLWDSLGFENPGLSVYHVQPGVVDTDMNKVVGGVAAIGFEDHGRCFLI